MRASGLCCWLPDGCCGGDTSLHRRSEGQDTGRTQRSGFDVVTARSTRIGAPRRPRTGYATTQSRRGPGCGLWIAALFSQ
ncbi:hypothetical protein D4Q52_24215 [Rhodopseudomonas palustris]|uniref:Uncharacterized protein n=1 Tax=Rhodopseudomonas palustris TaxID=1076 RepID=A0A418UXQ6_RHOPL|nr:hypothetical protein D4Q52_24215 [Rhodopseudomonas palustris]